MNFTLRTPPAQLEITLALEPHKEGTRALLRLGQETAQVVVPLPYDTMRRRIKKRPIREPASERLDSWRRANSYPRRIPMEALNLDVETASDSLEGPMKRLQIAALVFFLSACANSSVTVEKGSTAGDIKSGDATTSVNVSPSISLGDEVARAASEAAQAYLSKIPGGAKSASKKGTRRSRR